MNINKTFSKRINNKCLKYDLIEEFDLEQLIRSCDHLWNHLIIKFVNMFNQCNIFCWTPNNSNSRRNQHYMALMVIRFYYHNPNY